MKRSIVAFFLVVSVVSYANVHTFKEVSLDKVKIIPGVHATKAYTNGSIYYIKGYTERDGKRLPIVFFETMDKKVMFFGKIYDENGTRITLPSDVKKFKKYASFTYGNGKDEYYLFTDPDCPFCKRFEHRVVEKLPKDRITIHYFLFPLEMLHPTAKAKTLYVLMQPKKRRREELLKIMQGKSESWKNIDTNSTRYKQAKKELEKLKEIAQTLNVNGTPTLFDAKGDEVANPFMLPKRYNIDVQIDARVLQELSRKGRPLRVGQGGDKFYIFVDPGTKEGREFIDKVQKNAASRQFYIFFKHTGNDKKSIVRGINALKRADSGIDAVRRYLDTPYDEHNESIAAASHTKSGDSYARSFMVHSLTAYKLGIKKPVAIFNAQGEPVRELK